MRIALFAGVFLLLGVVFTKNVSQGDYLQNNNLGHWQGTLGPSPAGNDVAERLPSIQITDNAIYGYSEAQLTGGSTSGNIISRTINPDVSNLKAWKLINISANYPSITAGSSTIRVDVLCGDQASNCGPVLFDNPIPGFSDLDPQASGGSIDISSLPVSYSQIRLRIRWDRNPVSNESVVVNGWSMAWTIKSSVNLFITRTPAAPTPAIYRPGPVSSGYPDNSTVTYRLDYTLDRAVTDMKISLPLPSGTYAGNNYTVTHLGGGTKNGNNIEWNFPGNTPAGSVGFVTTTLKINTGPPDGVVMKTFGTISGSNITAVDSVEDKMTLESKSFLMTGLWGPDTVAPNNDYSYILMTNNTGYPWQGDMYNTQFTFNYSSCETYQSYTVPSGLGAPTVDTTNRKITFSAGDYRFGISGPKIFTVKVRSNATCGGNVNTSWNFTTDDQPNVYINNKTASRSVPFDATSAPQLSVDKSTWNYPIGDGQLIGYNIKFLHPSTVPITNFYVVDQVPAYTIFVSASVNPPFLTANGVAPNASNPYTVWTSNAASEPAKTAASWRAINPDGSSFYGSSTKWVKYEIGTYYWDKYTNDEWPIGSLVVITQNPIPAGVTTISNNLKYYAENICQAPGGCSRTANVLVEHKPYFVSTQYGVYSPNQNPVDSGGTTTIDANISNSFDYFGQSTSDAKQVTFTMKVPQAQYLDAATPVVSAQALCLLNGPLSTTCPDEDGNPVTNPPWLTGNYDAMAGTVTWNIPLIYSRNDYPQKIPFTYVFNVQIKTAKGWPDGQVASCDGTCTITVTGQNAAEDLATPVTRSYNILSDIVLNSSPQLRVTKDQSNLTIDFNGTVTYSLNYTNLEANLATGSAANVFVMDYIPENTTVNPPARMSFVSATAPNGEALYYMTGQKRDTRPLSTDARWTAFPVPAGQESSVDWVMWKKATVPLGANYTVALTVRDNGSSNKLVYRNKVVVGYNFSGNDNFAGNDEKFVTVKNPGFIRVEKGDVGSLSGVNFAKQAGSVSYDTASGQVSNGGSSISWTHTVANQTDRFLLVGVSSRAAAPPPVTSVTAKQGANPTKGLTFINAQSSGGLRVEFWGLVNPDYGSNSILVTFSAAPWGATAGATSFYNVNQATPTGTFAANSSFSTSPSVLVPSSQGDIVIDTLALPNGPGDTNVAAAGQTERWNLWSTGDTRGAGSSKAGGFSSTSMSWTTKNEAWVLGGLAVKPQNFNSIADYLVVGKTIDTCCVRSLKNWLVGSDPNDPTGYNIKFTPSSLTGRQINYQEYWSTYGKQAQICNSVSECFGTTGGDGGVKIFNITTSAFTVDSTTINNYTQQPLVLFINGTDSNGDGLVINSNLTIDQSTGIIFVVKGNIKVNAGVNNIQGIYLTDRQFATGRLGVTTGNQDAGKYAAVSIGRDKFARIAYVSDTDVRFIRCLDFSCQTRNFNAVVTLSSVSSVFMELDKDFAGTEDRARIVVTQSNPSKVYYIRCDDQDCNTKISQVIDSGVDADIAISGAGSDPLISEGLGAATPRNANYVACSDTSCATRTPTDLTGVVQDAGNDTQIELNGSVPVITYVERHPDTSSYLKMAVRVGAGGTGCGAGASPVWSCRRLTTLSDDFAGKLPSLGLISGKVNLSYNDTSQKSFVRYLSCFAGVCDPALSTITGINNINDCHINKACEIQNFTTLKYSTTSQPRIIYTAKAAGESFYEIRLAYCNSSCTNTANWTIKKFAADTGGNSDQVFTQALALGPESSDPAANYPRIVYYKGDTRDLNYIRCTTVDCSTGNDIKTLDSGLPITLPDQQLTVRGSVIAYGVNAPQCSVTFVESAICLERDLYQATFNTPGEIFIFEPRFYWVFRNVIKGPSLAREDQP